MRYRRFEKQPALEAAHGELVHEVELLKAESQSRSRRTPIAQALPNALRIPPVVSAAGSETTGAAPEPFAAQVGPPLAADPAPQSWWRLLLRNP